MTEQKTQSCLSAVFVAIAVAASAPACSSDDSTDASPEVTAYPNLRPTYPTTGPLLGYVANRNSDTVSVLDLDAMTQLGAAPVGRDPVDFDGPRHIVLDEEAGIGYVALSYPFDVLGPHARAAGLTERPSYVLALDLADLRPVGELRVDPNAEDIIFSPARNELLVSHYDEFRALDEPDPEKSKSFVDIIAPASGLATGEARARHVPLCVAPTTVAYRSDGTRAYVVCQGDDAIAVVDTANFQLLSLVPAGEGVANKPYALVLDRNEQRLLVSNQVARSISIFSADDEPKLLSSLYMAGVPFFAGWISDTEFVVPSQDTLNGALLIDATTGKVVRELAYSHDVCGNPSDAVMSRDGRLFMVCEGNHFEHPGAVLQLDPVTLEILARIEVGTYPDRLALREPPAP